MAQDTHSCAKVIKEEDNRWEGEGSTDIARQQAKAASKTFEVTLDMFDMFNEEEEGGEEEEEEEDEEDEEEEVERGEEEREVFCGSAHVVSGL